MNNRDKYFKGQQDNEELICFMRHHWITLVKDLVYFIIFAIAVYFFLSNIAAIQEMMRGNNAMKLLFLTLFLGGTIFIHRFFIRILNFFVNIGIITDVRFIDHQKTLFFRDSMDAIDMGRIQNVERVGEGVLPNILGYGNIKIFLSASAGVKTFYYIPNAKFHFRCIGRQKEARLKTLARERRQRSQGEQRAQEERAENKR